MNFLLDTHIMIWWLSDPARLDPNARDALDDSTNRVFVSVASIWEVAIKSARGRLPLPDRLMETLESRGVTILPIEANHALAVASLPLHHGDPFDRLLVAQAILEGLTLVTRDPWVAAYPVATLRA